MVFTSREAQPSLLLTLLCQDPRWVSWALLSLSLPPALELFFRPFLLLSRLVAVAEVLLLLQLWQYDRLILLR